MSVRVSFVVVSHSDALARGVCELAAQMAPDVHFEAAGGTDDGRIGTSYDRVEAALEASLAAVDGDGSGVIVLTDLGSATMTVESVIDMSDEPSACDSSTPASLKGPSPPPCGRSSAKIFTRLPMSQPPWPLVWTTRPPRRHPAQPPRRGSGLGLVDVGGGRRCRRRPGRPARAPGRRFRATGGFLRRRDYRQRGGWRVGPGPHGPGHYPRSERPHRGQWGRRHSGGRGADRYA